VVGLVGTAGTFIAKGLADDDRFHQFRFATDNLVLSRTVYAGTATTVTNGETLPQGCPAGPHGSFLVDVPTTTPGTTKPPATTSRGPRTRHAVLLRRFFGGLFGGGQKAVGVVGHDAIDPGVHQQAHMRALVYRPCDYLQIAAACLAEEPWRDQIPSHG
jgi:hypothetical protein